MGLFYIPQIQGFAGATPIQYLQSQYLTGKITSGQIVVYATDDVTATGNPLFGAIHHVSPSSSAVSTAVSSDLKTITIQTGLTGVEGTPVTVAIFGEPIVPEDEQSPPPSQSQ